MSTFVMGKTLYLVKLLGIGRQNRKSENWANICEPESKHEHKTEYLTQKKKTLSIKG